VRQPTLGTVIPTIGVLITYHNECELLAECLRSAWGQSRRPDEILIYDDASVYPAGDYIPAEVPARVIRGDLNVGPSCGRNILLQASRQEYVHFHDADDLFHPYWCERIWTIIGRTNLDSVFTEVSSFSERGPVSECVLGLAQLADAPDLVRFCLRGSMLVPAGTYRRSILLALGGYRESLWQSEDFDFHIRLAATNVRYAIIDQPLVQIRLRADSRSTQRVEVWTAAVQAIGQLSNELPAIYRPELASAAARMGGHLYKLGAHDEARAAFALAQCLGPLTFADQRRFYRILARACGPESAEWLASAYRRLLPERLRRLLVPYSK
jgi:glycosyltransferase involved in cell wall biosynthesis